jgi:mycofactocin precursor
MIEGATPSSVATGGAGERAPILDGDTRHDGNTLLVEEDLLVEEISIDGMCGVY